MNRITLKALLYGAFATLLILIGFTSYQGYDSLAGMNDRLNNLIDGPAEETKLAAQIRQDLLSISRAEKNIILCTYRIFDRNNFVTWNNTRGHHKWTPSNRLELC